MSSRGKEKQYQVPIKDIGEWETAVSGEGLLVTEIYSSWFGSCEVMLPSISSTMKEIPDADDKVKWALINVAKIEDDIAAAMNEEEQKKQEIETVKNRMKSDGSNVPEKQQSSSKAEKENTEDNQDDSGENAEKAESDAPSENNDDEDNESNTNKIQIPKLEKYSGFCHPMPLYVFFKNGKVVEELRGANPTKLTELVKKWSLDKQPIDLGLLDSNATILDESSDNTASVSTTIARPGRRGSMSIYAPDDENNADMAALAAEEAERLAEEAADLAEENKAEDIEDEHCDDVDADVKSNESTKIDDGTDESNSNEVLAKADDDEDEEVDENEPENTEAEAVTTDTN